MNQVAVISRPGAGRPTREQAQARHEELLDRALTHFLDKGYEQATIKAIADEVGMTKRTVYAKYKDKASLFHAAVLCALERYTLPPERIRATDVGDLEQTLINIAMLRIQLVASPQGLKLQRIIQTESYRFPEIFTENFEIGARPTVQFIAELLDRETKAGRMKVQDLMMTATTFMAMAVSGPVRFILAGIPLPAAQLNNHVRYNVRLFLDGVKPR